jgi:hypothetical protein
MSLNVYDIGALVELRGSFTDPDSGEPVDPSTVTCKVVAPDGSTITPTVTGSAGTYSAEVEAAQTGVYQYAMYGKEGHQAAKRGAFKAREPLPAS